MKMFQLVLADNNREIGVLRFYIPHVCVTEVRVSSVSCSYLM